ncbi:MAG: acetylglutamate kinase, partial [Anaerolineales bacterium]
PAFMTGLVDAIQAHQQSHACILVHGGGRAINDLMEKLAIEPVYKNGQRVTDQATLEVAEMVLSGTVNKKLVLAMVSAGVDAAGMSGVDRGLLQVEPWGENMALVGRIVQVRTDVLAGYMEENVVPVVSPISVGPAGRYNVNADHAAGRIAGALEAEQAIFITNTPGVLSDDAVIPTLIDREVHDLIQSGAIYGGMIPKVNAALDALQFGAKSAVITNLAGFGNQTGTTILTERKFNVTEY